MKLFIFCILISFSSLVLAEDQKESADKKQCVPQSGSAGNYDFECNLKNKI